MLKQLTIKNFALIEQLTTEFDNSFNVLTGETGAGKSLIVEAIGLLVGQRASSEYIRDGCEKAYIEGFFEPIDSNIIADLENLGVDVTDGLILNRELSKNGKNACRINGRLVPLSFYGEVGNKLVDIHGQNQELALLSSTKQIDLLDGFAGEGITKHKDKIEILYKDIKEIKNKIDEYQLLMKNKASRLDFLGHQINEIEKACLQNGEEGELQQERSVLMNYEKLAIGTNITYNYLFRGEQGRHSAYDLVSLAVEELDKLENLDPSLNPITEGLRTLVYQLDEFAREIKMYADNKEHNPSRLEEIDDRLSLIRNLKRKYNDSVEDIIIKLSELKEEYNRLEQSSKDVESHKNHLGELEKQITDECLLLHQLRSEAACDLAMLINQALEELDLAQAQFSIKIDSLDTYEISGMDHIEFYFSPNKGENPKPLAKIASGGEISRVMLAFKSVLNQYDHVPTIIFDEIDTGVGGETIINLSKKISRLANMSQIICVTHSAALASFADAHFFIFKEFQNERTVTKVLKLTNEERVKEIGRMFGGAEKIDTVIEHAREMLKFALNEKCV